MNYFLKASRANNKIAESLLLLAEIYNKKLNVSPLEDLVNSIASSLKNVKNKTIVFLLSLFYTKRREFINEAKKYKSMGEKNNTLKFLKIISD